jgi:hypothetical protein
MGGIVSIPKKYVSLLVLNKNSEYYFCAQNFAHILRYVGLISIIYTWVMTHRTQVQVVRPFKQRVRGMKTLQGGNDAFFQLHYVYTNYSTAGLEPPYLPSSLLPSK